MPIEPSPFIAVGQKIAIRRPSLVDRDEFVALAEASREFLRPWIDPPATHERYDSYLASRQTPTDDGMVICELASGRIVGVININCIVRGFFQSAYLGYWIGAPFANRGYMTEALKLLIVHAFDKMELHRLEANIQPENAHSIALVRRCGFEKEGFSPKYLKVFGEWRDHERWAIRAER
ncbi:MAG TPA: GNAT family protein [Tepidisphaeraceae bacterium]|nr:GNAT family protein [Tepidisphaeraceae bacterium]